MITPCIKICNIKDGRCVGCHRTLDQIANWTKYTDTQRQHIINENLRHKQSIS
jgi:predicted Fe-S protein YdhL (DUF1289 family)